MLEQAIHILVEGKDLPFDMACEAMNEIMSGDAKASQMAAFLTALRMKGESIEEITACATVMRDKCTPVTHDYPELAEIVGTGGDMAHTFNISTVSVFVVAAAGVHVAKHGNRSVSSKCGAADVLEELGAVLTLSAAQSQQVLEKAGLCFMFAPLYHPAMKHVMPVRKDLSMRTIFNILGPLSNPARANIQLLGVYDNLLIKPLAQTLVNLGIRRAMVVHGDDGLDEITLTTTTHVCEVCSGALKDYTLDPRDYGFELCRLEDLQGGDAKENAAIAMAVLSGETGPKRDVVLLNAGACLYLTGKAESLRGGMDLAAHMIDRRMAKRKLEEFVLATREVAS